MNSKHAKTLSDIFARPTRRSIPFRDAEALVRGLGGEVREREGSRVSFRMNGRVWNTHRPHPGKDMKTYQVGEIRDWLQLLGVKP